MDFLKTNIKFSKYHLIEENKKYYINNLKDKLKGPKKYNVYLKNKFYEPIIQELLAILTALNLPFELIDSILDMIDDKSKIKQIKDYFYIYMLKDKNNKDYDEKEK